MTTRTKLPTEMELWHEDVSFRVRFDYDRGESQWFDARAGVGSPGYDPSVAITEVDFGRGFGWESPDVYHEIDFEPYEAVILERLAEMEAADNDARAEAEAEYYADNRRVEE